VWLFDDGRYERTEAHGPTAAQNRNWAQSIAQAITSRRTRAREEATRVDEPELAEMQEKPTNLDLTEPPPF
ncbi:MAG: hypothetical protein SPK16_08295, partial [Corynebacterium sp.]|nr:hypothetical protein [Corynebacterium sp.]